MGSHRHIDRVSLGCLRDRTRAYQEWELARMPRVITGPPNGSCGQFEPRTIRHGVTGTKRSASAMAWAYNGTQNRYRQTHCYN